MIVTTMQGVLPEGETHDWDWGEFCAWVQKCSVPQKNESEARKRQAPSFSLQGYKGGYRNAANALHVYKAIGLDLDQVLEPGLALERLAEYSYIAWTTWKSEPGRERWRVVIELAREVDHAGLVRLVDRMQRELEGCAVIDRPSCVDKARLWFAPWYRASAEGHRVWVNEGTPLRSSALVIDFTGVTVAKRPEDVQEGSRNTLLAQYLRSSELSGCGSLDDVRAAARAWNKRLPEPLPRREVLDTARKAWDYWNRPEGLRRRQLAARKKGEPATTGAIGRSLMSDEIMKATIPESLVGDFLYPGATILSAKMKEGKSFLMMQLALAVATGKPFLTGRSFPGFAVSRRARAVLFAGEDTGGGIRKRFVGSILAGHLPNPREWLQVIFPEDLERERDQQPDTDGISILEAFVARHYEQGMRLLVIDPLRVLEAILKLKYPDVEQRGNVHTADFLTVRYYTRLAQRFGDLAIIISMHHGKTKKDITDPQDMIAGTSGFGAGAMATLALIPAPAQLSEDDDDAPKVRELYIHGRYTREARLLLEQDKDTGIWAVTGTVRDTTMREERRDYFEALIELGAKGDWVTAEAVAKELGRRRDTVHKMLRRMHEKRETYKGQRIGKKKGPGGGYRLFDL